MTNFNALLVYSSKPPGRSDDQRENVRSALRHRVFVQQLTRMEKRGRMRRL